VVTALEEVARAEDAPARGVATFDVLVDRNGGAEVHLESADSEVDAWSRLSRAMADVVARRRVRIPDGAEALRVTVQLDARVTLPDGRDPRTFGAYAETTGLKLGKDSMVAESVPGVTAGVRGKVCGVGIHAGLEGLAVGGPIQLVGGCSPENIGAVPVRIVHGKEISEAPVGVERPTGGHADREG
jgi:hypothetical protein